MVRYRSSERSFARKEVLMEAMAEMEVPLLSVRCRIFGRWIILRA